MATMFQQRHFEAVADQLQELTRYAHDGATGVQVAEQAKRLFADLFARNNGMFDRGRFERACVPGANVRARTR